MFLTIAQTFIRAIASESLGVNNPLKTFVSLVYSRGHIPLKKGEFDALVRPLRRGVPGRSKLSLTLCLSQFVTELRALQTIHDASN